jgi:hypothetical protein
MSRPRSKEPVSTIGKSPDQPDASDLPYALVDDDDPEMPPGVTVEIPRARMTADGSASTRLDKAEATKLATRLVAAINRL